MWRITELLPAMDAEQVAVFRQELARISDSIAGMGGGSREKAWEPAVRIAKGLTERPASNTHPDFYEGSLVMELKTLEFGGFEEWHTVVDTRRGVGIAFSDVVWDDDTGHPDVSEDAMKYWNSSLYDIVRGRITHMESYVEKPPDGSDVSYDLRWGFLLRNPENTEFVYFERRAIFPNSPGAYSAAWHYRGDSTSVWVNPLEERGILPPEHCHSFTTGSSPKLYTKFYVPNEDTENLIHISLTPTVDEEIVTITTDISALDNISALEGILGEEGIPTPEDIEESDHEPLGYGETEIPREIYDRIDANEGNSFAEKMRNYSSMLTARIQSQNQSESNP